MKIRLLYLVTAGVVVVMLVIFKIGQTRVEARADEYAKQVYFDSMERYRAEAVKSKDGIRAAKRGWQFLREGKTEMAIAMLERAGKLEPNYREAPLYLGYAYLQKINEADKKNWFEVKIELSREEQVDLLKKAKESLLAAQKIDPLLPLTNQLLGITCEKLGDDSGAKLWYARYEDLSQSDK